ncbi:MAG TPA: DUF4136 domain-containing protein [Acidobacteriaceae bacterium]|nr:DUF4136 domain-containing protein [Acidobacteriaceae bacterium]
MKALIRIWAAVLFTAAMVAPVFAQAVNIDYDHTVNFLKFKTYSWGKVHATDPSVENRITIALNRDMKGRYMTQVGSGGDVTITAVEATKDKQEFADFYSGLNGTYSWQRPWASGFLDSEAIPADVPVDTLVIDIYDTKTHNLLWRGTVTTQAANSGDKNDQRIDKAVTELISKYPPKFKKP